MKDFYRQKGVETRKLNEAKINSVLVIARLLVFGDYLSSADQMIPE